MELSWIHKFTVFNTVLIRKSTMNPFCFLSHGAHNPTQYPWLASWSWAIVLVWSIFERERLKCVYNYWIRDSKSPIGLSGLSFCICRVKMPSSHIIQEEGKADIKCKGCSMGCGRRSWCDMRKCNLSVR